MGAAFSSDLNPHPAPALWIVPVTMDIISTKVNKVTLVIKRDYVHALMQSVRNTLFRRPAVTLLWRGILAGPISPRLPCLV